MHKIWIIEVLWKMSLQASLMIPAVALCSMLLHKQSRKYSYALWLLVLLRLLVPVFVESPMAVNGFLWENMQRMEHRLLKSPVDFFSEHCADDLQADERESAGKVQIAGRETLESGKQAGKDGAQAVTQMEGSDIISRQYRQQKTRNAFVVIWLAGMTLTGLYFYLQFLRVKRQVAMAVWRDGNVWLCDRIPTPFVMGIVSPKIYIPFHLNEREEACILEHETMHISHCDHLVRLLGMLAVCLHWWNPLVWFFVNRMNQDMEMCCDEAVLSVKSAEEKKQYMTALLHFAAGRQRYMGVVTFGECQTEKRVMHLLMNSHRDWRTTALVTAVAVILGIGAFTVQGKAGSTVDEDFTYMLQKAEGSMNDISEIAWKKASLTGKAIYQDAAIYDNLEEIWGISKEQAEEFVEEFLYALQSDNRKWIAQHVSYPCVLKVEDAEIRIEDEEDFVSYYDDIFTAQYVEQLRQWGEDGLWANWQGITLGNGNIWFYSENGQWMINALVHEDGRLAMHHPVISSK